MRSYLCIMFLCSAVIFFLPFRLVLATDPPSPLIWWPDTNGMYYEEALCQLWVNVVGASNTPDFHIADAWGCDLHVTSTQQYFSHTHCNWSSSGGELVTPGPIYGSTMQSGEWGGYVGFIQDGGYGGSDPYHTEVYALDTTVTFDLTSPPDTNYYCYFDLEGVAFFDGQTNKSFTADLYVIIPEYLFTHLQTYVVSESGSYTLSYGPYLLPEELASSYDYYWLINSPGLMENRLPHSENMSGANPDNYHYVTKMDWQDWNTNSAYIPPDPSTNSPSNPYVDYPGPWDTNTYGPCPPYYSPWPPDYPPPPPLTQWPTYPPPNWPYNTNSPYDPGGPPAPTNTPGNPTNYPGGGGGGTNGGFNWSLSEFYDMFRSALRDEGQAYTPSDPAQYGFTYSNDLLSQATKYTDKFFAAAGDVQTNTDLLLQKGQGIFDDAAAVLSLPTTLSQKTTLDFGTFPIVDKPLVITIADWPIIGVFRSFLKWTLYFMAFWLGFRLIRRTLARTE